MPRGPQGGPECRQRLRQCGALRRAPDVPGSLCAVRQGNPGALPASGRQARLLLGLLPLAAQQQQLWQPGPLGRREPALLNHCSRVRSIARDVPVRPAAVHRRRPELVATRDGPGAGRRPCASTTLRPHFRAGVRGAASSSVLQPLQSSVVRDRGAVLAVRGWAAGRRVVARWRGAGSGCSGGACMLSQMRARITMSAVTSTPSS